MSFDDTVLGELHTDLFGEFGVDAMVRRGTDDPQPVRIVVDRNAKRLGDYGQVVGRMTTASFLVAQWQPQQGDIVSWSDRLGAHAKPVESPSHEDDGFVVVAVLHG